MLKAVNIHKQYGKHKVLSGLDFEVNNGDVYGFLGVNGSGKSTSLKILLNLIKADLGYFELESEPINFGDYLYLKKIGALIERPDFYESLSAYKNLKLLSQYHSKMIEKSRIWEVLEIVGLLERAKDKVGNYSMGMKQKLGIAQAIIHKPDLLILDEPSNGLDPKAQVDMLKLIKTLNTEFNTTVIFSTHQLQEVKEVANRMIIIDKGKKVKEGSVQKLIDEKDTNYKIVCKSPQELNDLLSSIGVQSLINKKEIQFYYPKDNFNFLLEQIVSNSISIDSINSTNSIEDIFLKNISQDA
jgi:ABC-type multidrug transport system ATPase subunit